jgi:hypothetical protein
LIDIFLDPCGRPRFLLPGKSSTFSSLEMCSIAFSSWLVVEHFDRRRFCSIGSGTFTGIDE